MFGVATTLGMGAQQLNAGLSHLFGLPVQTSIQLMIIAGVTCMATCSVVSGLDRGVRMLSLLAVVLALVMFIYLILTGPTRVAAESIWNGCTHYMMVISRQFFWANLGGDSDWQGSWTQFYWGWWISWSPFVGMFVARISRGRTIREFVLGVLFVPAAVSCIWFAAIGGIAINSIQAGNDAVAVAVRDNFPVAIFVFFSDFPLPTLLSVVGIAVIVVFFVTSSDSASLVIDYLSAGGDPHPPTRQRVFWGIMEGFVAAGLLVAGGLAPMRSFQMITGLPLCVIVILSCGSLVYAWRSEPAALGVSPVDDESSSPLKNGFDRETEAN